MTARSQLSRIASKIHSFRRGRLLANENKTRSLLDSTIFVERSAVLLKIPSDSIHSTCDICRRRRFLRAAAFDRARTSTYRTYVPPLALTHIPRTSTYRTYVPPLTHILLCVCRVPFGTCMDDGRAKYSASCWSTSIGSSGTCTSFDFVPLTHALSPRVH